MKAKECSNYESCMNYEPKHIKQPKFAVGDKVLYNDKEMLIQAINGTWRDCPYRLVDKINSRETIYVKESSLSPLPEMSIGKEWVLEQDGNPWNGFKVRCVREDNTGAKYEQWYDKDDGTVNGQSYPYRVQLASDDIAPIIHCIDPEFWTGEIEGERVRVYRDEDDNIRVRTINADGYCYVPRNRKYMHQKVVLAAIKRSGTPIMPYSQSKGQYDPPEEK